MTLREKALNEARPVLKCGCNSSCWCMRLHHKFPMEGKQCMSPQEILFEYRDVLGREDLAYLESLMRYRFEQK
jgi:hypothetical protein